MKKLLIILLVSVLFSQDYDIRKVNFGDSLEKVRVSESLKIFAEGDSDNGYMLAYIGKVAGLDTYIVYSFFENQLINCMYAFDEKHLGNDNCHITDYEKVKKILIKKYGEPKSINSKEHYWSDTLFKDDYESWGLAVSIGHLTIGNEFESIGRSGNNIKIRHKLMGSNYKVNHAIVYYDVQLSSEKDKVDDEDELDDF